MTTRTLIRIIESMPTSDGAGVKLQRSLGSQRGSHVDPFLMLDEFYSEDPNDYLAGFPAHPHRGFETVTYILDGHMRHEDHLGNRGDLGPGDVQWMTAGRGIIHSEMPRQREGRLRGFQLWLNLPSKEKMQPARYRDIPAAEIPCLPLASGGDIKIVAGGFNHEGRLVEGPVNHDGDRRSADPLYADVRLPGGGEFIAPIASGRNVILYPYEGAATVGGRDAEKDLPHRAAGVLSDGDLVRVQARSEGVRFLLLAAKPIGESVVQYGPFVMNTREEIEQALDDYREGRLAVSGPTDALDQRHGRGGIANLAAADDV